MYLLRALRLRVLLYPLMTDTQVVRLNRWFSALGMGISYGAPLPIPLPYRLHYESGNLYAICGNASIRL